MNAAQETRREIKELQAEHFFGYARGIAKGFNAQSWSASERLLVWNEFKRIVERKAFAR